LVFPGLGIVVPDFAFSKGTGPVYNVHKPGDYEGWYFISSYYAGYGAGAAAVSLFVNDTLATYGFTVSPPGLSGSALTLASLTVTAQWYQLNAGTTNALKANLRIPPRATNLLGLEGFLYSNNFLFNGLLPIDLSAFRRFF